MRSDEFGIQLDRLRQIARSLFQMAEFAMRDTTHEIDLRRTGPEADRRFAIDNHAIVMLERRMRLRPLRIGDGIALIDFNDLPEIANRRVVLPQECVGNTAIEVGLRIRLLLTL